MMIDNKKKLWSNSERNRHFIVPGDAGLDDGQFEIRTVFGESKLVDESAIEPFEVSREDAKSWIKAELNGVLDEAKASIVEGIVGAAQSHKVRAGKHSSAAQDDVNTQKSTPGLDLFAELAGSSQQKMRQDPADLIGSVTTALEDFGEILRKSQTGSDVDLAEAKARMKRMRETFNRHGIDVSDRADSLPDKLREFSSRRGDRESDTDATKSSDPGPHSPEEKAQQ